MSTMRQHGCPLLTNDYLPIPIRPGEKRPAIDNWQNVRLSANEVDRYASHGVGIVCGRGKFPIVAIDIDTTNAELATRFRDHCVANLGPAPERVGRAPRTLLVYRVEREGITKKKSRVFVDADGKPHHVEVLGHGQQFVAYHIHPDTRQPYEWKGEQGGLANVPACGVTLVPEARLHAAIATFELWAPEYGLRPKSASALPAVRSRPCRYSVRSTRTNRPLA
jgi:putative DNA primase/helicase